MICDLVIISEAVHTMTAPTDAQAVGIRAGHISAVCSAADAGRLIGPRTQVIEAPGGCIVPGLVDAHTHPILGQQLARGADLRTVTTSEDLHAALAAHAKAHPEEEWILGWGLDPRFIIGRNITAADIAPGGDGRPMFVRLFDGHSAVVDASALRLAGITGEETFGSRARIDVDAAGAPTGFLIEWQAMGRVEALIPAPALSARAAALHRTLAGMAGAGLVGAQVLDFTPGMLDVLSAAEAQAPLPVALTVSPWLQAGDPAERLEELLTMQGRAGARWRIDGIKLMIDGTIDNGSAWLERPDVNGESTSPVWLEPADFAAALATAHRAGIRTTTHAIGDAGIRCAAEAIAAAQSRWPDPTPGRPAPRHRIEHIETVPDETIELFAAHGIAASMQPTHCTLFCAADGSDNWSQRLGDDRVQRAWRLGSFARAGVPVALGSDWPIAPFEPLPIIADAQLRRPAGQTGTEPILPGEALTAAEALAGYTSARADSWQQDAGRIRIGGPAELSVFGADILTADPDELPDIPVIGTVLDGQWRAAGG